MIKDQKNSNFNLKKIF